MRAVIVHPPKPGVEFSDLKEPIRHGKGSVKVRLLENGICGSDREIVRVDWPHLDRHPARTG